mgnify:FL=1|jgi:protein-arginine kinase activator protein McsA
MENLTFEENLQRRFVTRKQHPDGRVTASPVRVYADRIVGRQVLPRLHAELRIAIEEERFEDAALLRERIAIGREKAAT